jgi:hypothetical protein
VIATLEDNTTKLWAGCRKEADSVGSAIEHQAQIHRMLRATAKVQERKPARTFDTLA